MADRIHPDQDFSPNSSAQTQTEDDDEVPLSLQPTPTKHSHSRSPPPAPPPGTYVIQLPKEQIFRYPPPPHLLPKNHKQSPHTRPRRNCCCCCFCWLLSLVILVLVLLAISVGLFFIIYRPKSPKYSVDKLSIQGFNLTSSSLSTVSPKVDVTLSAHNPNTKLSIYYVRGSSISISHSDNVALCAGVLPVYFQPTKNVTVFNTVLTGSDVILSSSSNNLQTLNKQQIPLRLNLKLPVRIKFGSLKTWTIRVKVRCDITVDKLTVDASVVSNKCDIDVKPW